VSSADSLLVISNDIPRFPPKWNGESFRIDPIECRLSEKIDDIIPLFAASRRGEEIDLSARVSANVGTSPPLVVNPRDVWRQIV